MSVVWDSLCSVSFVGVLHGCPEFPFGVPSGTIFGGFFVALTFVEAEFDTTASLAAWCPPFKVELAL